MPSGSPAPSRDNKLTASSSSQLYVFRVSGDGEELRVVHNISSQLHSHKQEETSLSEVELGSDGLN